MLTPSVVSESLRPFTGCSPPGSSVQEIFQARILEPIVISITGNLPRDKNLCLLHWQMSILYHWVAWEALKMITLTYFLKPLSRRLPKSLTKKPRVKNVTISFLVRFPTLLLSNNITLLQTNSKHIGVMAH